MKTPRSLDMLSSILKFFAHESCGQCSPCRVGTRQLADLPKKFGKGQGTAADLERMVNVSKDHVRHLAVSSRTIPDHAGEERHREFPRGFSKEWKTLVKSFEMRSSVIPAKAGIGLFKRL